GRRQSYAPATAGLARLPSASSFRKVLECGSALPLWICLGRPVNMETASLPFVGQAQIRSSFLFRPSLPLLLRFHLPTPNSSKCSSWLEPCSACKSESPALPRAATPGIAASHTPPRTPPSPHHCHPTPPASR